LATALNLVPGQNVHCQQLSRRELGGKQIYTFMHIFMAMRMTKFFFPNSKATVSHDFFFGDLVHAVEEHKEGITLEMNGDDSSVRRLIARLNLFANFGRRAADDADFEIHEAVMQLKGSIKVVRNAYNGTNKDETSFLLDKLALMAYALSQMVQQGHVGLV